MDHRGLPLRSTPGDAGQARQTVDACLDMLRTIRAALHNNGIGTCILQTIARPAEAQFGGLDLMLPGTHRQLVDALNRGLAEAVAGTADLLFDVAGMAELVGLADWHDPTMWNMAKLPFAGEFVPLYAEHFCRLLA